MNSSANEITQSKSFSYSFTSAKSPKAIFEILLNVEDWWSGFYGETIKGKSENINDEFTFLAGGGAHFTKQKLVELIPGKKITWLVTESNLTFLEDTNEWIDTKICFEIEPDGDKTKITFTHEGLEPEIECFKECSGAWTLYMQQLNTRLK